MLFILTIWLCVEVVLISFILFYSLIDQLVNSQIQPQFIPNLFNFLAVTHALHLIDTFHPGLAHNLKFQLVHFLLTIVTIAILTVNFWWLTGGTFLVNWGEYSYWAFWNGRK
jgi:hypothetical protein